MHGSFSNFFRKSYFEGYTPCYSNFSSFLSVNSVMVIAPKIIYFTFFEKKKNPGNRWKKNFENRVTGLWFMATQKKLKIFLKNLVKFYYGLLHRAQNLQKLSKVNEISVSLSQLYCVKISRNFKHFSRFDTIFSKRFLKL